MTQKTITIFTKTYDEESLFDLERDVSEAVEDHQGGTFKVTIEWTGDDE